MLAARWHKVKDIRVENIEVPEIKDPHEVKVKIKYCGICGSDLHEYLAGPIFIPVDKPHPISGDVAPIVMGHEWSAEVVEVGSKVTRVKVGDRVCCEPILSPHKDGRYLLAAYHLSPLLGFQGLSGGVGGFSEYSVCGEHMLHKLPDSVSYEQAALVEPAAVAVHAVRKSGIQLGQSAVVFGAGPIGLLVVEALKAAGAGTIFAVEVNETRRARAKALGAIPLDPTEVNVVEEVHRLTDGGADFTFEVTGVPAVLETAVLTARTGGETVIVSIWERRAELQPNNLVIPERNLRGVICYNNDHPVVLKLMEKGYFRTEDFVTKTIELKDVVTEGFDALVADKSQVKILVVPPTAE
ncbi:butanediol dehydrogenase [Psittacicella gerlachiana]|uniref:Butanediol dehydrogenase n=2 Tax=Psittacicella gerlachiana TaxID=2028574 RepID=A0A3A1YDK4_9GAMM|nr:butanediol dehydrogenase [Psittacicella gerlachiana]